MRCPTCGRGMPSGPRAATRQSWQIILALPDPILSSTLCQNYELQKRYNGGRNMNLHISKLCKELVRAGLLRRVQAGVFVHMEGRDA